ncbi:MAG: GNAT family N-acetyltransferase [Phycisphaerales bacterium]
MVIREATIQDAPAIAALRERTIRTVVAPLGIYSPDEIEAWASGPSVDWIERCIREEHALVAEECGRVVAAGRLRLDSPGAATLRGMFVDADLIGRGVGSRIIRHLLELGEGQGVRTFEVVATLNAQSFYERFGFERLGEVLHATPNAAVIPGVRMRRRAG